MKCPNCDKENTLVPVRNESITKYRGRKLQQIVRGHRCISCQETFMTANDEKAYNEVVEMFITKVNKETNHYTCCACVVESQCPFRWDPYNTNGDCLQMK